MNDIFMRELIIFLAMLGIFVGFVPIMIRGHHTDRIEVAAETADNASAGKGGQARLSKKRRARKRDAARRTGGDA